MLKIVRPIILYSNLLLMLLTIGAYLALYVRPSESSLISFLGLSYSGLLVLHLIFISFWLFLRSRYFVISGVVLLLEIFAFNNIFNINLSTSSQVHQNKLVAATYNMQFSEDLVFGSENTSSQFIDFLTGQKKIDILCVQESGDSSKMMIDSTLQFPFQYFGDPSFVGIYSRYPIVAQGEFRRGFSAANHCLWSDIAVGGDTIRVYAGHLESNRHDGVVPESFTLKAPEKVGGMVILGILRHYLRFSSKRLSQAERIKKHMEDSPYPVILCGDFNEVPLSSVYHTLSDNMNDSFKKKGSGMGTTLDHWIPGLRIDFILVDPSISVIDHDIIKGAFSDHHLVLSEIGWGD